MGGHRGGGPRGGPEHRIEMLQHELNLSTDQTEQVKALFAAERTRAEALRSNNSGAPEDRRAQMMSIRQETETKLRAMLTADQATKYDAMQARMRQHMQDRQGDGPPPPPSGQPQQ
jgi:Spy/CpxP family protein refolding chaperone